MSFCIPYKKYTPDAPQTGKTDVYKRQELDFDVFWAKAAKDPNVNNPMGLFYHIIEERALNPIGTIMNDQAPVSYTHLDVYKRQPAARYYPGS